MTPVLSRRRMRLQAAAGRATILTMADGELFAAAFERAFHLSLGELEASDYQIMDACLSGQPSPVAPRGPR